MMIASLLAAALALPAAAESKCLINPMTDEWQGITLALFLTDYTIPESSPRTATLKFSECLSHHEGTELRLYTSQDSDYVIAARTDRGGASGATTLFLSRGSELVELGTWAHRKIFFKGVGIDKVSVPNGDQKLIKNVFVLPEGAIKDDDDGSGGGFCP